MVYTLLVGTISHWRTWYGYGFSLHGYSLHGDYLHRDSLHGDSLHGDSLHGYSLLGFFSIRIGCPDRFVCGIHTVSQNHNLLEDFASMVLRKK